MNTKPITAALDTAVLTTYGFSTKKNLLAQLLKLAGCWSKEPHAQVMLELLVAQANNLWTSYWSKNVSGTCSHNPL